MHHSRIMSRISALSLGFCTLYAGRLLKCRCRACSAAASSRYRWMGWILKCALMSENTRHFTSCRSRTSTRLIASRRKVQIHAQMHKVTHWSSLDPKKGSSDF